MGRKGRGSTGKGRRRSGGAPPSAAPAVREPPSPPPAAEPSPPSDEGAFPSGLDLLLVLLPALLLALHPLYGNDVPLHLGIGEWILDHGTIPSTDPFSFTAGGAPWVPHEWSIGVLFAAVERATGVAGLHVCLVLGAAFLAWVLRGATRALGVGVSAHLLWSFPLWVMLGRRLILRPHLLALALPFLVWWILLRARTRPRLLWLVPPVMVVWVNVHGSFLLGLGILGLELVVCGARRHPIPWRPRLAVIVLAAAAILTQVHIYYQPDLLAGVKHALGIVGDPTFHGYVKEWRSPLSNPDFRSTWAFQVSVAWIALAAWGGLRGGGRLPLSYRLFVVVTLVLYLRHQRFLALFAPAALPLMPFPRPAPAAWRRAARLAALAGALFFLYPGYPIAGAAFRRAGFGWDPVLPVHVIDRGLARYPESLLPRDRGVFCEYGFGGVVIWKGLQPTMDGRNSVYGSDLYLEHREALDHPTPFREGLLESVGAVLIDHPEVEPARRDLIDRLAGDPRWEWKLTKPRTDEPYLFFLKHERRRTPPGGR